MANPWDWWLEDFPQETYAGMAPRTSSRGFTDYWKNRYGDVYDQWGGANSQRAAAGLDPNITFTSFLSSYPWLQNYLGQSPGARGQVGQSKYAPRTRWLV